MKLLQPKLEAKRAKNHWLFRYGLAIGLFAATIGLALLLNYFSTKINLTIPIVFALVATAWYGGRGPGFLISVLFEATTIIYTPIPPDSNLAKAWFGYFSVFALYIFLVLVISGLRQVQTRLAEQRDLLHVTLASIGDAVITTDTEGRVTFLNPAAARLTGWEEPKALGATVEDVFSIVDEKTGEQMETPVARVLAWGTAAGLRNHTILRSRSGREIPIIDSAEPIRQGNQIKGVVLVFADITEQKRAELAIRESETMHRIVDAQEAERHRIARDLHDHLGQRMTALRLGFEALTENFAVDAAFGRAIRELRESASHVDRDIGFLSWELRPTELENLGLVDALRSFVREWSMQYGIEAEFQASKIETGIGSGRLKQTVETNLYRIVQEALNNVLKHADAQNVSVLFHHRGENLVLVIEDDGRGFDQKTRVADVSKPGGLGLIGMSERAALLNGTMEIDSGPENGTTIMVQIPLH